jgi:hypothetical protein
MVPLLVGGMVFKFEKKSLKLTPGSQTEVAFYGLAGHGCIRCNIK